MEINATPASAMSSIDTNGSSSSNANVVAQPPNTSRELKLPPVVIPKFDGAYQNWTPFHDMFKALIHDNRDMPSVHKLHYLKSSLSGEAEHLLRHFQQPTMFRGMSYALDMRTNEFKLIRN